MASTELSDITVPQSQPSTPRDSCHLRHLGGGRGRQQRQVPAGLWMFEISPWLSAVSCQSALVPGLHVSVGVLRDDLCEGAVGSDYINDRASVWPVQ